MSKWISKADLREWDKDRIWRERLEETRMLHDRMQLAKEKSLLQEVIESLQHTTELVEKLQREINGRGGL